MAWRTAMPRAAMSPARSRRTARPTAGASTMAKTLPAPTAMSSGTSPTSGTFTIWSGWATNAGVHLSVTSRTRSPSSRTRVSTGPASVSMSTGVVSPRRATRPVSTATVAAPMVASPQET